MAHTDDDKERRLAEALRRNLKRRKAAARARAEDEPDATDAAGGESGERAAISPKPDPAR